MVSKSKDRKSKSARLSTPLLSKAIRILRHVVSVEHPMTQVELSRVTAIPTPTLNRLLADLEQQGWIVQDRERCRIEVGPTLVGLSAAISRRYGFEAAIRPILKSLVAEIGETVCLSLYDDFAGQLVTFLVEETDRPLGYRLTPSETSYLHSGASGRAVLAFLPEEKVARIIHQHGLPKITPNTITSPSRLYRELRQVRRDGFAFSRGERMTEAIGIAAPIFTTSRVVVGSLLVTIPNFRFDEREKSKFGNLAIRSAAEIAPLIDPIAIARTNVA